MNIKKLDLNLLSIFNAIYETRNISHAAEQLTMNQPTISNALGRLRKQLDDPLFVREGRKMMPTCRAREIIIPVRRALSEIHSISYNEEEYDPINHKREFRIHMVSTIELAVLEHLSPIIEKGRGATIELLPFYSMTSEVAVATNAADIAIGLSPIINPELNWEELCDLSLVLMARKGNTKIKRSMDKNEFINTGAVSFNIEPSFSAPGSKGITEKLIVIKEPKFNTIYKLSNELEMTNIVSVTYLVAIVPLIFARALPKEMNVEFHKSPISGHIQPLCMIWRESRDNDPGLIWLRNQIKEAVQKTEQREIEILV